MFFHMNALRIKTASRLGLLVQASYGSQQTYMLQQHHVILNRHKLRL
jgi:hypothetical protein